MNTMSAYVPYISIGSAPTDEACVQVTSLYDYLPAMRGECLRFIVFIRKHMGPEPFGARLRIKTNVHDFGTYLDVVCEYDDTDETATEYALRCEGNIPSTWDAPTKNITCPVCGLTIVETVSYTLAAHRLIVHH